MMIYILCHVLTTFAVQEISVVLHEVSNPKPHRS